MAVTIKQIAEKSGVSRGTVDRVLNHRGNVSPDTEALITRVASDMGYKPNIAGKALAARKKKFTIGVLLCSEGIEFFDEVIEGLKRAESEASDYGVNVLLRTAKGYDVEKQLKLMEEMSSEINLLILNAINDPRVITKMERLYEKGIEVITINTDVESGKRLCHVGSNYRKSGETAGGLMGLVTGGKAKVLIATGSRHVLGHIQRPEGFTEICHLRYPDVEIVSTIETEDDGELAYQKALTVLRKHPEINAIYIATSCADGICRAIAELGRESDITVIASDYTKSMQTLIADGRVKATICQQPYTQGYKALHLAVQYLVNGIEPYKEFYAMKNEIKIFENV